MSKNKLLELAELIGWQKTGEENGQFNLEYLQRINEIESLKHVVMLKTKLTDAEFLDVFGSIIAVLPKKLKKTIFKLTKQSSLDKKDDLLDLVSFTIEEFKAQSEFKKLTDYAEVLGVDLAKLGYGYSYELTKKQRSEIIAKIESVLPLEILPIVGKIKKTEFKMAYVKTRNEKILEQDAV